MFVECKNCTYWREPIGYVLTGGRCECRRHAPVVVQPVDGYEADYQSWPQTRPDDGCGDGEVSE